MDHNNYIRWLPKICCALVKENRYFFNRNFATVLDLNEWNRPIKLPISPKTYEPISDEPSYNLNTMIITYFLVVPLRGEDAAGGAEGDHLAAVPWYSIQL